ncbi:MAG TPA: SDR family NAD(P)-dependent oxidoreductase [Fimbriiglobus sp.]|jgi:short-subunit dehydrogenase
MPRRDLNGKRILVTGASQGIGRALCCVAARRGCQVVAAARSKELLDDLAREVRDAGGTIEPVVADVTDPADRTAMVETVRARFGGLDVLVNNAGIGATGHFMDSKPATLRQIFDVNFFGLCELTRLCIPDLKTGRQPLIVNVSSVMGRRALPARALYASSKFALAGWSEAIRAELSLVGIGVLVVNPGLTQTNFSQNLLEAHAKIQYDHLRGMSSDDVAEKTWRAAERNWKEITLTGRGLMLVLANRFLPKMVDYFARKKVREIFADEIAARKATKS